MLPIRKKLPLALAFLSSLAVLSCSGGTLGPKAPPVTPASNVESVVVDAGPANTLNTLYTTVTICVPNTTTCQSIDHVQVDTGSSGLRILASVLSPSVSLQIENAGDGNSLVECVQFVDGYSWGPVAVADVKISGETASSVPIQVIGATQFTHVPAGCSSTGPAEDTVDTFGANGILGIGVFAQDCGAFCTSSVSDGFYYSCTATQCVATTVPLALQVPNPVTSFPTDNNGVVIQLPSVASQGAATLTGSLILGIDTQSNNRSGSQTLLTMDPDQGFFTTVFNNETLSGSFFDTGSSGFYFNDSGLQQCTDSNFAGFYCPAATQNFTAVLKGGNDVSANTSFSVSNAESLSSANPSFAVFSTLAGTFPSSGGLPTFDWGLPFYFGRTVYTAVEGRTTSAGTGPYVAF